MAQYRSRWTGEVIDDAVGKAKNITYLDVRNESAESAYAKAEAAQGIAELVAVYKSDDGSHQQYYYMPCVHRYNQGSEAIYYFMANYSNNRIASVRLFNSWAGPMWDSFTISTVDSTPTEGSNNLVKSGGVKSAITKVETDLASIHATGPTNTTGAAIAAGTYFYLAPQSGDDEILVQAQSAIAIGATFTSGTNYEAVTAGALNQSFSTNISGYFTNLNANVSQLYAHQNGKTVSISFLIGSGTPNGARLFDIDSGKRPAYIDTIAPIYSSSGALIASGSVWIERDNRGIATYYGSGALSSPAYAYMTYTIM